MTINYSKLHDASLMVWSSETVFVLSRIDLIYNIFFVRVIYINADVFVVFVIISAGTYLLLWLVIVVLESF